jgi:hypothetical protein
MIYRQIVTMSGLALFRVVVRSTAWVVAEKSLHDFLICKKLL